MLRTIQEFPSYSMNEKMEVFDSKGVLIGGTDAVLQLTVNGKRYNRSRNKLFYTVFPELKVIKKHTPHALKDADVIPDTEPARYNKLNELAKRFVANGHNEFVGNNEVRQALWNFPASSGTNRIVFNGMSYDDLMQETLLKMYEILNTIDEGSAVTSSYLEVAVRNSFLKMHRNKDPLNNYTSLDYTDEDGNETSILDTYEPDLDELDFGVSDDIIEKLQRIRAVLNKQDYEIIYYYYGYEMSMDEIAERVGLARQTVSGRIKRIADKLHNKFNRR